MVLAEQAPHVRSQADSGYNCVYHKPLLSKL